MRYHRIPDETIRRLPVYLRGLMYLSQLGRENVSSRSLAEFLGFNPWQIRKDFSYFGGFGVRGVGYKVDNLTKQIKRILRLEKSLKVALVGVGNLGSAILAYPGFIVYGFDLCAAYDSDTEKIGKKVKNVTIQSISNIHTVKRKGIELAIIAVPRESAQKIADKLVEVGVKGILNFSPSYINAPRKVKVITIDIAMDLARLPYYMPAG